MDSTGFLTADRQRPELVRDGCVELVAVQAPAVFEAMGQDGVAYVRREFIEAKYGDAAWSFIAAYGWFARELERAVPRPALAASPYWLYRDAAWAAAGTASEVRRLRVPAEELVLFDLRLWTRVLGLEYLGGGQDEAEREADEQAFAAELARQGLPRGSEAFRTAFYPLVRQRISASWARLLTSAADCPETYLQAACWRLCQDWLA